ncbi:hypothetical protein TWF506_006029 [Arthrobotrys conoides]|uniref:Uncharacterized protein n=1 Tax=Arthrobotrys conoides TaxID=74498 RepID=A0AAN8NGL7_9PEZI
MPEAEKRSPLSFTDILSQNVSPLFTLPGEIRNLIWAYALAPYNDPTRPYPADSVYRRPDYWAPQKSDVALLRTCKAVYTEAWHFPYITSEICFYLTDYEHMPWGADWCAQMQNKILEDIQEMHEDITVRHMRIFVQSVNLQPGDFFKYFFDTSNARPRTVTITIRHADFAGWKNDDKLSVSGNWVRDCRFPNSVETIRVEFESVERKSRQVDEIAAQAVEKWEFERKDGKMFSARVGNDEENMEIMRWAGDSNLDGVRWIRDIGEDGKMWYFVKAVIWRVKAEGRDREELEEPALEYDFVDDDSNREVDIELSATESLSETPTPTDQITAVRDFEVLQMSFALKSLDLAACCWQNHDSISGEGLREMASIWRQAHPVGSIWRSFSPYSVDLLEYYVPDELWGGMVHHDDTETPLWEINNVPEFPELGEEPWPLHKVGRNRKVPKLIW